MQGIATDFPQCVVRKVLSWFQSLSFTDGEAEPQRTRSHPWTHVTAWTRSQVFHLQSAARCLRVTAAWGESWRGGRRAHSGIGLVFAGPSDRICSRVSCGETGNRPLPILVQVSRAGGTTCRSSHAHRGTQWEDRVSSHRWSRPRHVPPTFQNVSYCRLMALLSSSLSDVLPSKAAPSGKIKNRLWIKPFERTRFSQRW